MLIENRTFILEIYYEGESIEQREYAQAGYQPNVGELVYLEFQNPNYSKDYGHIWVVKKRRFLLPVNGIEVMQLFCEPCDLDEDDE